MKTTYVLNSAEIKNLKLKLNTQKLEFIDYFLDRKQLIRWYKHSPNANNDKNFFLLSGLIDISYYTTSIMPPEEAKQTASRKNVIWLVNRKRIGEVDVLGLNELGTLYKVVGEHVQGGRTVINEFHLVFDDKIDTEIPVCSLNFFYGNIYDYLEQKLLKTT